MSLKGIPAKWKNIRQAFIIEQLTGNEALHKTPPFSTPFWLLPMSSLKQAANELDTSGLGFILPVVLHLAIFQIFPSLEETITENRWCVLKSAQANVKENWGFVSPKFFPLILDGKRWHLSSLAFASWSTDDSLSQMSPFVRTVLSCLLPCYIWWKPESPIPLPPPQKVNPGTSE